MKIPVGLSNHHVHISDEAKDILFGKDYKLTNKRNLKQIGQFACEETLNVEINGHVLENLRIIGPCRKYTQVELLKRDFNILQTDEVWSDSGKLEGTLPIKLIGPKGEYTQNNGGFIAYNHIHFSKEELELFDVNINDRLTVKTDSGIIINSLTVKCDDTCSLEFHLNKDEGEKLGIETFDEVEIEK